MKKWIAVFVLFSVTAFALEPGTKAPDFSLKDTAGKTVTLSDYKGKTVVLIFVSTRCPYSNAFNKVMTKLNQDYSSKGVVFLGINSNKTESMEQVAEHARGNFNFQVLKDEGNKVADAYKGQVTPEAYVIDGNGIVRYHGALGNSDNPTTDASRATDTEIRAALDQLLAGKEIARAKTKAFGCTIKRV